ncbi:hypothetical protein L596_024632 [Steinernema carpocapsae]|uniref:Uncharacterized protein n=1 Tax=Steinernema carpocapsae TaxID=34508 RepID=A0A4V5ZYU0_STECR|nr:hypothetical protein L596_024632 [Steinernema carpocapsae]
MPCAPNPRINLSPLPSPSPPNRLRFRRTKSVAVADSPPRASAVWGLNFVLPCCCASATVAVFRSPRRERRRERVVGDFDRRRAALKFCVCVAGEMKKKTMLNRCVCVAESPRSFGECTSAQRRRGGGLELFLCLGIR